MLVIGQDATELVIETAQETITLISPALLSAVGEFVFNGSPDSIPSGYVEVNEFPQHGSGAAVSQKIVTVIYYE